MRSFRSRAAILTLLTLLSTALLLLHRLPRLSDALHSDESEFLLLAETQKSGGLIYRDMWISHTPGLFFLLAALPESLLRHEAEIRLVSVAALAAAVFFLSDLCLAAGAGLWATAAGAAVFVLLNCNTWLQNQWLQTEQLMAALLAAALWALIVRRNAGLAWLLLGVGLVFKQSLVAWLPFFALLDWLSRDRSRSRAPGYWLSRAWIAAPMLAVAGYFLLRGGLSDFWRNTILDALQHTRWTGTSPNCDAWYRPLRVMLLGNSTAQTQTLLTGLGACLLGALVLDRGRLSTPAALQPLYPPVALLSGALLFLKLQHCGRIYYLEALYPALFLFTAWAWQWCAGRFAEPSGGALRRLIGAGGLLSLALGIVVLSGTFSREAPGDAWSLRLALERDLARALPAKFPDHKIYTMSHPGLYWYSGRTPPRCAWSSDILENFPGRRGDIHRDVVDYGRGRRLLVLFHHASLTAGYPETLKFRDRLLAEGAVPFNDDRQVDARLLTLYELYEWDLTRCGPAPARCPPDR